MTKSAFYLILKALLEIFLFFDYVEKRLDKKAKVISKLIESKTNNFNIHITLILRKKGNQTLKIGQIIGEILFLKNYAQNMEEKLVLDPYMKNQN